MVNIVIPNILFHFLYLLFIPFFSFMISFVIILYFLRENVQNNWSHYKCNPLIMFFSYFFGYNAQDTLASCTHDVYKQVHKENLNPYFELMQKMSQIMNHSSDAIGNINTVVDNNKQLYYQNFRNIFSQINNTSKVVQFIIIKMETILEKLISVLIVMVYTLSSTVEGIRALQNDKDLRKAINVIANFDAF